MFAKFHLATIAAIVLMCCSSASAQIGHTALRDYLRAEGARIALEQQASEPQQRTPPPQRLPGEEKPRINEKEAQELFRSVDSILKWVSNETRLPVEHEVRRKLTNRAELQQYLEDRMDKDGGSDRLKRAELVLKKFGLLPRDFDLGPFLVRMLREQVLAFYDHEKKTVFLMDWVDPQAQRPVLAHELTHALQDQAVDLDKWLKAGVDQKASAKLTNKSSDVKQDKSAKSPDSSPDDVEQDERESARDAISEGQGMLAMIDYVLEPVGRTAMNSPEIIRDMVSQMAEGGDSPVFRSAPLYLREELTFPYKYGLEFEREVYFRGGRERAFAGVLREPPSNTREVMEPHVYLQHEQISSFPMPAVPALLGPGYEQVDVGIVGEFDVHALVEQFANVGTADRLSRAWRGGYYFAAMPKNTTASKPGVSSSTPQTTAQLKLLYVSRWASPKEATEFARIYANSLSHKYRSIRPAAEAKHGASNEVNEWTTEEGPVQIETIGSEVFVAER